MWTAWPRSGGTVGLRIADFINEISFRDTWGIGRTWRDCRGDTVKVSGNVALAQRGLHMWLQLARPTPGQCPLESHTSLDNIDLAGTER